MKKNVSFEEAFNTLEELVGRLEDGGLSLDESMETFEEAVKLVKLCNAKIEQAEQKVKMLVNGANGEITDKPFDTADET